MADRARTVLRDVFGYRDFRPGQEEIIERIAAGENLLAVMPTGAGKSLCFQIPAILASRLTVIVSPLVALMDDQSAALEAIGVPVATIHSGNDREYNVVQWRRIVRGEVKLVYMSPERLMTARMLAAIARLDPGLFVVDEAHCISKWGASFRPEYEALRDLKTLFPKASLAAFTATADHATRMDIAEKLFDGAGHVIVHGFDRPNLYLAAEPRENWRSQLKDFLKPRNDQSGVIYCLSRRATDEVTSYLVGEGINAISYHAGHPPEMRRDAQVRFMRESAVMVATVAFGMGIDKPDIRFVCHLNLPASMEAFYQEIGRAGRDGLPADTLLFFGLKDIRMRRQFIDNDGGEPDHILREHKRLDALIAYAESARCRRMALLAYFDEAGSPCGNCDNCVDPPAVIDGSAEARLLFATVRETGQSFGASHVIDVLRGVTTDKVRERGHDALDCFGTGAARSSPFWQAFLRQAVAGGFLIINIQRYGCLEITRSAEAVIDGVGRFSFREIMLSSRQDRRLSSRQPLAALSEGDRPLFHALKELRRELARERSVPAYVIFPDVTLLEMAAVRPASLSEMSAINGVGPKKLSEFGGAFLALMRGNR